MKKPIEFWEQFGREIKYSIISLLDPKISIGIKTIPFLGLLYILSPIDIIPDVFVGPGFLDDIGIFILAMKLFIALVENKNEKKDTIKKIKEKQKMKSNEDYVEEGEI